MDFSKITPALNYIRDLLMKIAEFISKQINVSAENVHLIILILISIWGSMKILGMFYSKFEGRWAYVLIVGAIIFFILKYI